MACDLVLAPSFPTLLDRLLKDLDSYRQEDPLAPTWLIVPTSTAANHLRLRLARQVGKGVWTGVRVAPLMSFIRRLNAVSQPAPAPRWGPVLDLLLYELVEELPPRSPLARLQRMPSGYRLLHPTFLDLADGGFGPEQGEILTDLLDEPDLTSLERETLQLYIRWLGMLQERQLGWEPVQHQGISEWILETDDAVLSSALACESGQSPHVLVYGFYDFTDVNTQVLAALARRVHLKLFYPFAQEGDAPHPALYFGEAVLEDLRVRLGTALAGVEVDKDDGGHGGQDRQSSTEPFFLSTFPEGEIAQQPSFLTFQRASGNRAEAISAAVRIRQWLDDPSDPISPEQILIVARETEPYLDPVRDVFVSFAIPIRFVDVPARLTPENRPFRMISRIWEEGAPAEWVLAYLRDCSPVPAAQAVSIDRFESKIRELGVWGGPSWNLILGLNPNDPGIQDRNLPQFTAAEKELVKEILDLWGKDFGSKERRLTPRQCVELLKRIRDRWLPEPSLLDLSLKALQLVHTARPDLSIKESLLREIFLNVVADQIHTDPTSRPAVSFVPLMRARSLAPRALVFLGLASGTLPARVEEDPLLSDTSRRRLVEKAQDLGHRLPIKSHVTDEMSMLFFLLNTSAQFVHWVIPDSDDTGRSVAPTPWVQRYLQRWEQAEQTHLGSDRILRGPAQQAEYLAGLDQKVGFLPPDFLSFIRPELTEVCTGEIPYAYLFEARSIRDREPSWNGHVPAASLPAPGEENQRVRVTSLETLAKCPYRFYARELCEWKPLFPLEFAEEMNALDWGGLLHYCLESLIVPYVGRGTTLSEIAEEILRDEGRQVTDTVARISSFFPRRLGTLPELFQQVARDRLIATSRRYLEQVPKGESGGSVPVEMELRRQVAFPAVDGLGISGRIDRVDKQDDRFRIYDYKSGRTPNDKFDREVSLGHRIQPILYPWIFRQDTSEESEIAFAFIYLGDSLASEKAVNIDFEVEAFLKPLAEILQTGMYLPTPRETMERSGVEKVNPCQYCEYGSLCRRFDRGAGHRLFRLFKQHLDSRLQAFRGCGWSKEKR